MICLVEIADGPLQEAAQKGKLLGGEALRHALFRVPDVAGDLLRAGVALFQQADAPHPPVIGIGPDLDEALAFHAAEDAGHGGMAQAVGGLKVPGAGGLLGVGQVADDMTLGGGQVQLQQPLVDGLVQQKMQSFEGTAQMFFRFNHFLCECVVRNTF